MFCSTPGSKLNWKTSRVLPFGGEIDRGTEVNWKICITKLVSGDVAVKLRVVMRERLSKVAILKLKFVIGGPEYTIVVV